MRYNTKYYNRRTKNLFKSRKKNQQGKRKKVKQAKVDERGNPRPENLDVLG